MSEPELITISRDNIEEKNSEYTINGGEHHYFSKITCHLIRVKIKSIWKEANYSLPKTYIFLGQYPNAFLYGFIWFI